MNTYVVSLVLPPPPVSIDGTVHWYKPPGVGFTKPISPVPLFSYFFHYCQNALLAIEYLVYIWQMSPQLSCGDSCQIWMWFKEFNTEICKIENFAYGEINEQDFSNPHPRHGGYGSIYVKIQSDEYSLHNQRWY